MDKIQYFLTILAWPVSIWSVFCLIITMLSDYYYNCTKDGKLQQCIDGCKGVKTIFHYRKNACNALLSIAWLITYYYF